MADYDKGIEQLRKSSRFVDPDKKELLSGSNEAASDTGSGQKTVIKTMMARMAVGYEYWRENYARAADSVDFTYFDQWDANTRQVREELNRPCLNINMLPAIIARVVSVAEKSQFSIKVRGIHGKNENFHTEDGYQIPAAEVMAGLLRFIELKSKAAKEYASALKDAVDSGFGFLGIEITDLVDDPFNSNIKIKHIKDRWSVLLDPYSVKDDGSDANWAVVSKVMSRAEFKSRYPDKEITNTGSLSEFGNASFTHWWSVRDQVRVCEYYFKEEKERKCFQLQTPDGRIIPVFQDTLDVDREEFEKNGYKVMQEKTVNDFCIKRVVCTSQDVLEQEIEIPCRHIPVVPVYGRTVFHGGRLQSFSLVEYAKDAQSAVNYWISVAMQNVGQAGIVPFIVANQQLEGVQQHWNDIGRKDSAYLPYNHVDGLPKPGREPSAAVPQAELQLLNSSVSFIRDVTGATEAFLGEKSNETSGKAIEIRKASSESGMSSFFSNLESSVQHVGVILMDMVQRVFTHEQIISIMRPDEKEVKVAINQRITDPQTGYFFFINNFALDTYELTTSMDTDSSTLRAEFVDVILKMASQDPTYFRSLADIIIRNMDVPGSAEMADRLKRMVPKDMLPEYEQDNIPDPKPTPEQELEALDIKSKAEIAKLSVEEKKLDVEASRINLAKEQGESGLATSNISQNQGAQTDVLTPEEKDDRLLKMLSSVTDNLRRSGGG